MRAAAALAVACGACGPSTYACTDHDQCAIGQLVGVCQPDGLCSFPDDVCPSGQRYGEHSGAVSGQCVAPAGETDASTTTTEGSTSSEATSLSSTATSTTSSETSTTADATTDPITTSTSSESSTTSDIPIGPDPLLWFSFDEMQDGGIPNLGTLGGVASCDDESCPSILAGPVGNAARFDGLDDCAIFPFARDLGPIDALTITAWIQRGPIDADYDCVLCKPVGVDPWNTWRLATYDGPEGPVVDFRVGTANDSGVSLAASTSADAWSFVVGTWDGEAMRLWVDGVVQLEQGNALYEVDEQPVYLGCDDDHDLAGVTNFLTGSIDEVRFYARALAADEIAALLAEGQ